MPIIPIPNPKPPFSKAEKLEYLKERYRLAKEAGTCVRCYKLPAEEGRVFCRTCNEKKNRRERERHAERKNRW